MKPTTHRTPAAKKTPSLEMVRISKSFPGVRALAGVSFSAFAGEVTALLGENGSGKSTLMKILAGIYPADAGEIYWQGQRVVLTSVRAAQAAQIAMIHQELNLFPNLTIAENIFFARETTHYLGKLNRRAMHKQTTEVLKPLDITLAPETPLGELSIGQQQLIEIAKALHSHAKLIIFDEPTTALTHKEITTLFKVIRQLRDQGRTIIYISHRLQEIFSLADRMTILRDGIRIGERLRQKTHEDELVYLMVGRTIKEQYPYCKPRASQQAPLLTVKNLSAGPIANASFTVNKGEILGIAGLMGAGRSELARALIGYYGRPSGTSLLNGEPYYPKHPHAALKRGICYVSEDRKKDGLFLGLSIFINVVIASLARWVRFVHMPYKKLRHVATTQAKALNVKMTHLEQDIYTLSGGNQQKVAIARALTAQPQLIILDEPTKGIDVGAKLEFYNLINRLKQQGIGIIMISSELTEVLGLSDRILVIAHHRLRGTFLRHQASAQKVMKLALAN